MTNEEKRMIVRSTQRCDELEKAVAELRAEIAALKPRRGRPPIEVPRHVLNASGRDVRHD